MYNFSGIIFRIWGVCGIFFILGLVSILIEKPWKNTSWRKGYTMGLVLISLSIVMGLGYLARTISPDVSCYTGEYVESHRNSRVAPPLPVTYQYVFWNGGERKQVFYLDVFSGKELHIDELQIGKWYVVYYDSLTNVIVRVEPADMSKHG